HHSDEPFSKYFLSNLLNVSNQFLNMPQLLNVTDYFVIFPEYQIIQQSRFQLERFVERSRYAAGKKSKIVYNSYKCSIPDTYKKGVYHDPNRSKPV
ncbi:MAG: hypothetical protein WC616_06350, partial [Candidatus Omnitrophota bacterium]